LQHELLEACLVHKVSGGVQHRGLIGPPPSPQDAESMSPSRFQTPLQM
jgi:hypothetical protein